MRFKLPKVQWSLLGLYSLVVCLALVLTSVLIQVKQVAEENKELRTVSETLVRQLESVGQRPVVRPTPGETGPIGPEGPRGPQGPAGKDGQSIQGPPGSPGETIVGPSGVPGIPGSVGATGADGVNGTDGKDGATGPRGPQGEPGSQGETGPAGPAGSDGRTPSQMTCTPTAGPSGEWECTVTAYE